MSVVKQVAVVVFAMIFIALAWFAIAHRDLLPGVGGSATTASTGGPGGPGLAPGVAGIRPTGPGPGANVGGGGPGAGSGGRPGGAFGGPAPVTVAAVTIDSSGTDIRTIATLAAANEVTLYSEATGTVAKVDVKPGQTVKAGEPIIELDSADQSVAVEKAKVTLASATEARQRAEKLVNTNNAPASSLSDAETAEKQAEIALQTAQLDLDKRTIKAPFDGTVGLIAVSVGDLVGSQKAITTLDDLTRLKVSYDVPQRVSALLKEGSPVVAESDATPGVDYKGTVTAVDSRVDPEARTLRVEATLANDSGALKPGMAVAVQMTFPGKPLPAVPSLAVQWDRKGSFVWRITDSAAHRVPVEIVARHSGVVTVAGDLKAGDEVVVEGVLRLREGAKVNKLGGDDAGGKPAAAPAAGGTPVARDGGGKPATPGAASEAAATPKT